MTWAEPRQLVACPHPPRGVYCSTAWEAGRDPGSTGKRRCERQYSVSLQSVLRTAMWVCGLHPKVHTKSSLHLLYSAFASEPPKQHEYGARYCTLLTQASSSIPFEQRGASHCPAMRVISTCGRPDAGQEKRDTTWRPRPQGTYLEPRISATAHMYTAPRKEHEYTRCNMGLARSNRRRGIACCWSQGPIRHLRRYLHRATLRVAPG